MTRAETPLAAPGTDNKRADSGSPVPPHVGTLWGLGLVIFALWMLIRPNRGVAHDGMIYALYALARLYPDSLGHDFFVRFGTQDHFTVFGPLYAASIHFMGLDHATALLTFVNQAAFFFAAWRLLRRLTSADNTLLGLGLLIVLPSWYGADKLFSHTEMFLTPRQSAEALVLLGISFIPSSRRAAAAACLLAAALLHPIIATAGIMLWIIWEFGLPHPGRALIIFISGGALCAGIALIPHSPLPRFDHEWLTTLQSRLSYLFPSRWRLSDWCGSVPGLTTLFAGALLSGNDAIRKLSAAALATVATGLILALTGSDLMHVILAAQLQPWRWLWLSGVLAALLLPPIAISAWQSSTLGRATALLLIAGWLTSQPALILVSAALAGTCAVATRREFKPSLQRAVLMGAIGILALALIYAGRDMLSVLHQVRAVPPSRYHLTMRISQLRILASSVPLAAAIVLGVWYLGRGTNRRSALFLAALGATACAVILPLWALTWVREEYPAAAIDQFAPWRRIIPTDAEVLWPDTPPLSDWYSLHRASYWSSLQMAGMVFSRQDFDIGVRREKAVTPWLPYLGGWNRGFIAQDLTRYSPAVTLANLCAVPDVQFLASWRNLGPTPYPSVTLLQSVTGKPSPLYLYHCHHERH